MPDDTAHSKQVQVTNQDELSEDESPLGIADPVMGPAEFVKVRKWLIGRVFYFLAFISVICLGAVAIVPNPVVRVTALGVWAGSIALAKFLLEGAYRNNAERR